MSQLEVEDRIRTIFALLFQVDPNELVDSDSRDTIRAWDSLQHLNLILALEEEFGVKFRIEDATQMLNFGLVRDIVIECLV